MLLGSVEAAALRRSFLFGGLPDEELEDLVPLFRRRSYGRGEVVFHQGDAGDCLYVVLEGQLKVQVLTEEGEEVILTTLQPGDSFGELALLDPGPRSATVVTFEPTVAALLNRDQFLGLLAVKPQTLQAVLAMLSRMVRRLTDDVADLCGLGLADRLGKKLIDLAAAHGRQVHDGVQIDLAMTQDDLAAMVGGTRSTVNQLIGMFEDRGALTRRGRRIVVLRPELLYQAE